MTRGRQALTSVSVTLAVAALLMLAAACGSDPQIDEAFPPGNPVLDGEPLGDNPVLGSEGPGINVEGDDSNYVLLTVLALCLIGAGVLLVKLERWERRRSEAGATT